MALVLKKLFQSYFVVFYEKGDPRANDYILMSSPIPIFSMAIFYLYFVFKLGPALMKNRRPFNIENLLLVYNFSQIIFNGYILYQGIHMVTKVNWICEPVDLTDSPDSRLMINLTHSYFLMKLLDLLDTLFFILRKKNNQVTFLHVYHHFGMLILSWLGTKFLPGGHSIFVGFFNLIVHMVMYFYYLVSTFSSKYKTSLWWKKHITQLQLMQFLILLIMFFLVMVNPNCEYPKWPTFFIVPQNLLMLLLFGEFYYKTYIKPKTTTTFNGIETKEQ